MDEKYIGVKTENPYLADDKRIEVYKICWNKSTLKKEYDSKLYLLGY